jgi:hypothetical protein
MEDKQLHLIVIGSGSEPKNLPSPKDIKFVSDYSKILNVYMSTYFINIPKIEEYEEVGVTFIEFSCSDFIRANPSFPTFKNPIAYYDYTGNTDIRQTIRMVNENPLNPNRFFYTERSGGSEGTKLQELMNAYHIKVILSTA